MSVLPFDIQKWRYPWSRRRADAWTSESTRAVIKNFVEGFVETRNWASRGDVAERFVDTGINRRQPFGPTEVRAEDVPGGDAREQSPGLRLITIGVTRGRDERRFEVALTFREGNDTESMEVDRLLMSALLTLDAEHRRIPPP